MTREKFLELVKKNYRELEGNLVELPSEGISVRAVDEPLVGFASADDPIFEEYRNPDAIGNNFKKLRNISVK